MPVKIPNLKNLIDKSEEEKEKIARRLSLIVPSKDNIILSYCWDSPKSIADISKHLDIKRSTLIHYLKNLKEQKLILEERIEKGKKGRPTLIKVNKKYFSDLETERRRVRTHYKKKFLEENKELISSILEAIRDSPLEYNEIVDKIFANKEFNKDIEGDIFNLLVNSDEEAGHLLSKKYHITKEGLDFLKKES